MNRCSAATGPVASGIADADQLLTAASDGWTRDPLGDRTHKYRALTGGFPSP